MSSRFVSSGAIDTKTGDAVPVTATAARSSSSTSPSSSTANNNTTTTTSSSSSSNNNKKSEEWAAVQSQLEAGRQRRAQQAAAAREGGAEGESRSLYEVLQANKAAKQAAFEEASRIKNQFRALDEDEVDFLDEVAARRRREEEEVRRETEEGLRGFREAQKVGGEGEGEGQGEGAGAVVVEGGWALTGRKRKRKGEGPASAGAAGGLLKGVKRRVGGGEEDGEKKASPDVVVSKEAKAAREPTKEHAPAPAPIPPSKPKAGLVDYGSDDDDSD